jgi:hypothetical protein
MKKNKLQKRTSIPASINTEDAAASLKQKLFWGLFILILLSSIVLKIYKVDYLGTIYDEAMSFWNYGRDYHTATHTFDSTNNHILNSVFICWAYNNFKSYENFVRIPSLIAGIVFSLAAALVVYKSIRSDALRLATLGLVIFTPYVFDYSYLARGYAYGLAALMAQIAFILWLLDHRLKFRYFWIPAFFISLMNFLSFGAMMSSIIPLAAFNLVFVLLYSPRIFRDAPRKLYPIILTGLTIFLASLAMVFLLYRGIYKSIPGNEVFQEISSGWHGWKSFVNNLSGLSLYTFGIWKPRTVVILGASGIFLLVVLAYYVNNFRIALKGKRGKDWFSFHDPGLLVILVTIVTLLFMFLYGVILNKSLGLVRNSVFLIPPVLLSIAIIWDRFANVLKNQKSRKITRTVFFGIILSLALLNPPPLHHIFDRGTAQSKPILRRLRAIDPDKTWVIGLSRKMRERFMGFSYYLQFDYKFKRYDGTGKSDVVFCHLSEVPDNAICLDWDCFRPANCAVVIYCPLPKDRIVLSAELLEVIP